MTEFTYNQKRYSRLAVLTPYIIPEVLRGRKIVNIGDGIILKAIERFLGQFDKHRIFSPRVTPSNSQETLLASSEAIILGGANQLNDRYTIWPGLTAERLRSSSLRLIPFGIGLHGEEGFTDGLSEQTKAILRVIHERIDFSSWRCPHTVNFLERELPDLKDQFLMTGCPVVYDKPLLGDQPFRSSSQRVAVTVTERHDFWERETRLLDFVARNFRRSQRYLVLHQNYSPPSRFEHLRHKWLPVDENRLNQYQQLRRYAVRRGFRVVCPDSADACISFYDHVDMHIGSRLHAHLLFLSRAKRTWLIPVDGRSAGMADFLGFPLCQPEQLESALDFDFNITRQRAQKGFETMQRFLNSIPNE